MHRTKTSCRFQPDPLKPRNAASSDATALLLIDLLERTDYQEKLLHRMRGFDLKMLMDTCSGLRHNHGLQRRLFKIRTDRLKVKDCRVIRNFYLNLSMSYDPSLQQERGITTVPILFLMCRSDTRGTHLANTSDLIYRRPDLFP